MHFRTVDVKLQSLLQFPKSFIPNVYFQIKFTLTDRKNMFALIIATIKSFGCLLHEVTNNIWFLCQFMVYNLFKLLKFQSFPVYTSRFFISIYLKDIRKYVNIFRQTHDKHACTSIFNCRFKRPFPSSALCVMICIRLIKVLFCSYILCFKKRNSYYIKDLEILCICLISICIVIMFIFCSCLVSALVYYH